MAQLSHMYMTIGKTIVLTIRIFPEKGMATHSNILAWEFLGQRSLVGYSP